MAVAVVIIRCHQYRHRHCHNHHRHAVLLPCPPPSCQNRIVQPRITRLGPSCGWFSRGSLGRRLDGVVSRNQKRPDKAGAFEAVRITVCEFPHWLRTRKGLRWIPICYPKHDDMHDHGVTISNIVIALLKSWFPSGASKSFETGLFLRHEGRSQTVHLKMRFGPMPQDADAFKHVCSLKGSSGQSPCPWCSNCMARVPYFEDDSGFAHLHSPAHHEFTQHSNDTFFVMVFSLEIAEGDSTTARVVPRSARLRTVACYGGG